MLLYIRSKLISVFKYGLRSFSDKRPDSPLRFTCLIQVNPAWIKKTPLYINLQIQLPFILIEPSNYFIS